MPSNTNFSSHVMCSSIELTDLYQQETHQYTGQLTVNVRESEYGDVMFHNHGVLQAVT